MGDFVKPSVMTHNHLQSLVVNPPMALPSPQQYMAHFAALLKRSVKASFTIRGGSGEADGNGRLYITLPDLEVQHLTAWVKTMRTTLEAVGGMSVGPAVLSGGYLVFDVTWSGGAAAVTLDAIARSR